MILNKSNDKSKDIGMKAYKNIDFLTSHDAREIRILSEYMEPDARFKKYNIENTVVFFGSARSMCRKEAAANLKKVQNKIKAAGKTVTDKLRYELISANGIMKMVPYYEAGEELAFRIALWGKKQKKESLKLYIASGGGDGMMKAANSGAIRAKSLSIGLNISLPMEQSPNPFISPELGFEFHYFFMRKFWFLYLAKALVILPGGFGTLDEFMEAVTLLQTRKLDKPLPIILLGTEFWNSIINFDKMVEWGVIAPEDLSIFHITDNVEEAFNHIINTLKDNVVKNSYYKKK